MSYYLVTVAIYFAVDAIACIALDLQFGVTGVINFGFIIFQACGAYVAAVLSLPSDTAQGGFQHYVLGLSLPFPYPWLAAILVSGLLALPIGLVVLRRLRNDYQAISLIVTSVIATLLVTNSTPFLNGSAGVALVPAPFAGHMSVTGTPYEWLYIGVAFACAIIVLVFARRVTYSPYGRSLRSIREHEDAAAALGKNVYARKVVMFVVGGALGGLSGAVLVGYIGFWAPSAWLFPETVILIAAIIVGGRGNQLGAVLGALLVPLGFEEVTRFIPSFGSAGLTPAVEWVVIGSLILGFLWFRPRGVIPERRRVYGPPRGG